MAYTAVRTFGVEETGLFFDLLRQRTLTFENEYKTFTLNIEASSCKIRSQAFPVLMPTDQTNLQSQSLKSQKNIAVFGWAHLCSFFLLDKLLGRTPSHF